MMMPISIFALRLAIAFVLGALIGLERQYRQKSAGLRTNTLVSVGAAAFILLSVSLTDNAGDPSRVAGQIVTGIGFLGAGVIMKTGMNVQGLNTAATIWCSAAVGTLAGAGLVAQAVLTAAVIMLAHLGLRPIGIRINRLNFNQEQAEDTGIYYYTFKLRCKEEVENHLRALMLKHIKKDKSLQLRSLKSSDNSTPAYVYVEAQIMSDGNNEQAMEKLAAKLTLEYGVTSITWEVSGQQDSEG
ncbi:MgtC/SapB family protein [Eisenibacter elegans]|jgi:putative Mg2+ transporter-C (MgtC) family protein|uniref:MgtC/SapB family protein n=1 Tax=Eisenibacter elegans TaxID=997 RepID=UPI00040F6957|nr:MgtC/SapB family protein [Eisenibacter elegans]